MAGIGHASYASSGTVTIYSAGGLEVDPSPYTYTLTSPTTMPLGLTTATLSSIGTNTPNGYATGEASATADLAGRLASRHHHQLRDRPVSDGRPGEHARGDPRASCRTT